MSAYVDTSVLLRHVLRQPGALRDLTAIDGGYTSAITQLECARTLDRLRLAGELDDVELSASRGAVRELIARLNVLELEANLLERASMPFPTTVRTLDAIHLASALVLREDGRLSLAFASHDLQQRTAAQAIGFHLLG